MKQIGPMDYICEICGLSRKHADHAECIRKKQIMHAQERAYAEAARKKAGKRKKREPPRKKGAAQTRNSEEYFAKLCSHEHT